MEVHAAKGKFMIHMLHSAYFFPQTVDVKWTASAQGKPNLPVWLHLFHSRHRAIAYLIGTPVTPFQQITIHVIARRLDNYQSGEQLITIIFNDDVRFNSSSQQIAEIKVKNIEAEEFLNTRNDHIKRLEKAIQETFRGKGVNPYIYNIINLAPHNPPDEYYRVANRYKMGSIIQVGTQRNFHPNLHRILDGLRKNPHYCTKGSFVPMDRHFRGNFDIDWCKFDVKNMTMIKSLENPPANQMPAREKGNVNSAQIEKVDSRKTMEELDAFHNTYRPPANYFWQSIVVFPSLAVFLILLVLLLSVIFFGRREGQHWRDYTTPKEQLQEYLNVRESQRHLRELSVQRQMLLMSNNSDRGKSATPMGINAFLQPKNPSLPPTPVPLHHMPSHSRVPSSQRSIIGSSQQRLPTSAPQTPPRNRDNGDKSQTPYNQVFLTPRNSVARMTGSSLHLYRNPLDDDVDSDGEDAGLLDKYERKSNTLR
ncbi:sarcoglycan alpha/epsilon domain-containing protein [Ditylenchus destructor]|nr:sarcoglycan alpha/epsilon domain-containing protein [Ditylenchus destructor]